MSDVCVYVFAHSMMSDSVTPRTVCSPPGSSVHGISQARMWAVWVRVRVRSSLPLPSPGDLPDRGIKPTSLASPPSAGRFFTSWATRKASHVWYMSVSNWHNYFLLTLFLSFLWSLRMLPYLLPFKTKTKSKSLLYTKSGSVNFLISHSTSQPLSSKEYCLLL